MLMMLKFTAKSQAGEYRAGFHDIFLMRHLTHICSHGMHIKSLNSFNDSFRSFMFPMICFTEITLGAFISLLSILW